MLMCYDGVEIASKLCHLKIFERFYQLRLEYSFDISLPNKNFDTH